MSDAPTRIAVAVVERNGQFLVGERPTGKPLAGYAEFPGGRVEAGETPEQAAVRECFEETGLRVAVVGRYDDREHDYTHDHLHLYFFACHAAEANVEPLLPFRWVSRADLGLLEFPDANQAVIRELVENANKIAN